MEETNASIIITVAENPLNKSKTIWQKLKRLKKIFYGGVNYPNYL